MYQINRMLRDYLDFFFIVFIENILVYSKNESDHMDHLRVLLQVLTEHKLFAMYRKWVFWLRLVAFLCYIISSEGVEVDLKKTELVEIGLDPYVQPIQEVS